MAEPRNDALGAARLGHPPILLAARKDIAADVEAPGGLVAGLGREPHLRERDPELGIPSLPCLQRRDFPYGLVVVVGPRVADLQIAVLDTRCVHLEDVRV